MNKKKKIVFVSGDFNILHPGHLRLLKFAKECGDYLIVGVNSDKISKNKGISEDIRLEFIKATSYVDEAFILNDSPENYISKLKPSIVVKGSEFENRYNPEQEVLKSYGGKLIFNSGDIKFSSLSLLKKEIEKLNYTFIEHDTSYIKRQNLKSLDLLKIIDNFKNLNILVIGDTILDEYIMCEPLGMSQEDTTVVVTPILSDIFLGGAGIVAAHAVGLGANVDFFTVLGDDENSKIARKKLKKYNVNSFIYKDNTRPTTLKKRFRAHNKTLLRVNHVKQHHISKDLQDKIINDIKYKIEDKDLIVFSDFSYGCLPQRLIDAIIEIGLKYNKIMVADSQSSSQTGDISKFKNMMLVTPTEREARFSLGDFESGLIVLAEKLRKKSNIKNVIITLGAEGLLIHADDKKNSWITDQITALNSSPKDVSGAGDSFLIATSMAIASGTDILKAAYIGSLAAACQVARIGNIPLKIEDIKNEITF